MAEVSSNTTEARTISKDVIEAVNLLAHGKRNILCGEVIQAVNQLQEACRILGNEYGETADECADAYYCYGTALLELHRSESVVFGHGMTGESDDSQNSSDDDSSDEDDNSINDPVDAEDGVQSEDLEEEDFQLSTVDNIGIRASSTPIEPNSSSGDSKATPVIATNDLVCTSESILVDTIGINNAASVAAASTNDLVESSRSVLGNSVEPVTTTNPGASEQLEENMIVSKTDADEDISNLQLAWEMLELSKLIYQRHERRETKLKLAENFLKLGEIGLETEQFEQATSDFSKCLELQRQILPEDHRRIAETLYQLGLACTMNRDYDKAVDNYRGAIHVMEIRSARMKRIVAGEIPPDTSEPTDGFYTPLELAGKEIEELDRLIPDIFAKIDDVRDEQSNADKVSVLMKESIVKSQQQQSQPNSIQQFGGSGDGPSTMAFQSSSSQQLPVVHNISHLVRKKKKVPTGLLKHAAMVTKKIKAIAEVGEQPPETTNMVDSANAEMEANSPS